MSCCTIKKLTHTEYGTFPKSAVLSPIVLLATVKHGRNTQDSFISVKGGNYDTKK